MAGIKVQDVFNGRFFEIPKYQRGYAWDSKNIKDLILDIQESIESGSNHYIGTLVLSRARDNETFYVVDGQQRITTITLLINALIKSLDNNKQLIYRHNYLKEDNRYRLLPLGRDREFFIGLLKGEDVETSNKSQRLLKEANDIIEECLSMIADKYQYLKSIERLEVMEFVENSEGDAIRIFQTVNDRGKPLSNMEKAKSLLIYFSNCYLEKVLDDEINNAFSDIFEFYDDIKHIGENLNITLVKNKEFNEDNLMRYHFVSYCSENYDPSASFVFNYLKTKLGEFRAKKTKSGHDEMYLFIKKYIEDLRHYFLCTRNIIERANCNPKYYKLFPILNLSATLYPLITKMEMLGFLENHLPSAERAEYTFFDLIELIDVRVYKTRGTDPKADIARLVSDIGMDSDLVRIEDWLLWFNSAWMSKEYFNTLLVGDVYGNRAIPTIFIDYCEALSGKTYEIDELKTIMNSVPTIEHILSQTPNFGPRALGFRTKDEFFEFEGRLGNLTLLEKRLNSQAQNKNAVDKNEFYAKSSFKITKKLSAEITMNSVFNKDVLNKRTEELVEYILKRWWC